MLQLQRLQNQLQQQTQQQTQRQQRNQSQHGIVQQVTNQASETLTSLSSIPVRIPQTVSQANALIQGEIFVNKVDWRSPVTTKASFTASSNEKPSYYNELLSN